MWRSESASRSAKPQATIGYFLGWAGTDARPFIARRGEGAISIEQGERREALSRIAVGAGLVWVGAAVAARFLPGVLAGWVGMIGLVVLMHFGASHLLSIFWRRRGVAAMPIMNYPGRAVSLGDFWARWNRGFRDVAYRFVFRPALRRTNLALATLATFAFSGVLHDLVISIPARAGYGRPTLYFLIQAIGVLWEKSRLGRRMPAWLTRAVMFVVLIAPLPLLFPATFVERVAVPFLRASGAFAFQLPTVNLVALVFAGGLLHFGILIASALVPQVLDWRGELRKLAPLSRQLVWVHGAFIVLTIIGLGAIVTLNAPLLAGGATLLARCVAAFIAIFWGVRLALQFVLFDPGPLLTKPLLKLGYHGLTFVFAYLAAVFGWAAIA
jgi:alginate O-acetyltransferase complex protein AlgI